MVRTSKDPVYRRRALALLWAATALPLHATRPQDLLEDVGSRHDIDGEVLRHVHHMREKGIHHSPEMKRPVETIASGRERHLDRSRAESHHRTETLLLQKDDANVVNLNHRNREKEYSHKYKTRDTDSSGGTENAASREEERRHLDNPDVIASKGTIARCCRCGGKGREQAVIWSWSGECSLQCKVRYDETPDEDIKAATTDCDPPEGKFKMWRPDQKKYCQAACIEEFDEEDVSQDVESESEPEVAEKPVEKPVEEKKKVEEVGQPVKLPKFHPKKAEAPVTTPPPPAQKDAAMGMHVLSRMVMVAVLATIATNTISA